MYRDARYGDSRVNFLQWPCVGTRATYRRVSFKRKGKLSWVEKRRKLAFDFMGKTERTRTVYVYRGKLPQKVG